jgi:replication factor C large subunit
MAEDWTEIYRPKKLSDVIGNPSAVKEMLEWARSWDKGIPKKRAIVLMGDPGVGKTSSASALANDMGWDLIEMNASDQRTGDAIKHTALRGAFSNSFGDDGEYRDSSNGRRKLIVLDEADNLFGNADRGALPAINELIKTTRQPVVLIVNDFFALSKKSAAIKTDTIQISFRKPTASAVSKALRTIAAAENITASQEVFDRIAENAGGDMRAAVRDLESLSLGGTNVTFESADNLSERVVRKDMYDVLDRMFRKDDPMGARKTLMDADTDPDTALLWIDENLPYEYRDAGDLVRGYEKMSRADIFLGRVHRRQHYGFWSYAGDMMTAGVSTAKLGHSHSSDRLRSPLYLMKMSRSRTVRGMRKAVSLKLAIYLHTSTKRVELDLMDPIRIMATNDLEIRTLLIRDAGLEPEELGFLLDAKIDSPIIKDAVAAASVKPVRVQPPEPPEIKEPDTEEPKEEAKAVQVQVGIKKTQKNIFDF